MRRGSIAAATLAAGICTGALLGGCGGSGTTTVDQSTPPPAGRPETQAASSTPTTTATSTPSTTPTTPAASTGGTGAPSTTRTAPEPAFAQQEAARRRGERGCGAGAHARATPPTTPPNTTPNRPCGCWSARARAPATATASRHSSSSTAATSAPTPRNPARRSRSLGQGDTEVTLAYPLYRSGDPLAHPGGGQATVRFQLNDGKLDAPRARSRRPAPRAGSAATSRGHRERLWSIVPAEGTHQRERGARWA